MKMKSDIMKQLKKIPINEPPKKKKESKIDQNKAERIINKEDKLDAPMPAPAPAPAKKAAPAPKPAPVPIVQPHQSRRKTNKTFTIDDTVYDGFNAWCKQNNHKMSDIIERLLRTYNEDADFRKTVFNRIFTLG